MPGDAPIPGCQPARVLISGALVLCGSLPFLHFAFAFSLSFFHFADLTFFDLTFY